MSDTCGRTHVERAVMVSVALSATEAFPLFNAEGVPIGGE